MNHLPIVLFATLATACATEASPVVDVSGADAARLSTFDVCHVDVETGESLILNLGRRAVRRHIEHGDWLVSNEVCGDGVDNDCDGVIDNEEDCCPLFAYFGGLPADGEYDAYEFGYAYASDTEPEVLQSYTDVYFYGWNDDQSELRFSVDFYDMGSAHEPTYGDGYQYTTVTWIDTEGGTITEELEGEISASEYTTCTIEAFAWSDASAVFTSYDTRDGL